MFYENTSRILNKQLSGFALSRAHRTHALLAVLLIFHAVLLGYSACKHSPTVDEPAHLAAGVSHWKYNNFDLYSVNPPLVRMVAAIPVLFSDPKLNWSGYQGVEGHRDEFSVGRSFAQANGQRLFWLVTLSRFACIPFSMVGLYLCFQWSRELFGDASGLLAAILWCFSPTILANGPLITPDVPSATATLASLYCLWKWLNDPSWTIALTLGGVLGFGLLIKSTLLVIGVYCFSVWIVVSALQTYRGNSKLLRGGTIQMLVVIIMSAAILNAGYLFEGSFRSLGSYQFRSQSLSGLKHSTDNEQRGNRFKGTVLAKLLVPVPANYLLGIDAQKWDFEEGKKRILWDELRTGPEGWWYFYLVAAAVKIPIGVLLLIIPSTYSCISAIKNGTLGIQIFLLVPLTLLFSLVSSQSGLSYWRYVIPALPIFLIWLSQSACLIHARSAYGIALIGLSLGWFLSSSLSVYPHSLSYFNEFAGGPKHGIHWMVDSNLDWGQDLIYLQDWIHDNPQAAGMNLEYFGHYDPEVAGVEVRSCLAIRKTSVPIGLPCVDAGDPEWYAISATELAFKAAKSGNSDELPWYQFLMQQEPDARAGHSILIYKIRNSEKKQIDLL